MIMNPNKFRNQYIAKYTFLIFIITLGLNKVVCAQLSFVLEENTPSNVLAVQDLFSVDTKSTLMSDGTNAYKKGDYEAALTAFKKVTEMNPDYYDAWIGIGNSLFSLSRFNDAIEAFDATNEINPNLFEVWYNKGLALYFICKYDNAIKCFDNALILKPEYYEILNIKGMSLNKLTKYDEAIKAYEIALSVKPDFFDAIYNMACTYAFMGDKEKVSDTLSKLIQLNTSYKETLSKDLILKDYDILRQ